MWRLFKPRPALPTGTSVTLSPVGEPVVRLTGQRWVRGHKLELRWLSAGPSMRYRVYWTNGQAMTLLGEVTTAGAIIELPFDFIYLHSSLSVSAVTSKDEEGPMAGPVLFEPTPENAYESVRPLPPQAHE